MQHKFRLTFVHLVLFFSMTDAQTADTPLSATINNQWEFRQAHKDPWREVGAPSTVHTALLQHGLIEDPFFRNNEEKLQWIANEDWEYRCTFRPDDNWLERKHIELVFRGLDTYAQVYLNDSLIIEADNMFRTWRADVKRLLKPGDNTLHVYFESPLKKKEAEWNALGYELPGGPRVMSRKAQYHYGWDWGPTLTTCGILQKPEIVAWNDFLIEDVFITPLRLSPDNARMVARIRYRSDFEGNVSFIARDGKRKFIEERRIQMGVAEDSITFDVPNPQLWWCNGMGDPHLYDFAIEVKRGITTIDKKDVRTGIRTVQLVRQKDDAGESFYFELNGKPIFCRGANYIPQDVFLDRARPEQYKALIESVASAHMNMLRVWGGGIYERDIFYQLCDARGIMVWQDFMYACAMYPGSGSFLKNAAREAGEQIERLRQHPCVVLWCGNNENLEGWNHWGWQMKLSDPQRKQVWRDYELLFRDLLPTYVANYGGDISWWESSPSFGRANPKSNTEGDSHYWGVWHDEEPFDMFNQKVPRFMSEYGFQSFPEWRTIEAFTEPDDRTLESKVMLAHQKHPKGNALIAKYMKRDYRTPKRFEDFVYISQLLQAEGIRTGIEAHRRNKPYCMGTLYWQLNDVWPGASWSSIDYFGRWKALHYYARDAYAPVVALPIMDNDILKVYASNDLGRETQVTVQARVLNFEGKKLSEERLLDLSLSPDSNRLVWQGYVKTILAGEKPENAVVEIRLTDAADAELSRRLYYFEPPRKLSLPNAKISMRVRQVNEGYALTLESPRLVKNVLLSANADGAFSDNYFDLLPGERRTVLFKTESILDEPNNAFRAKSLVDTY